MMKSMMIASSPMSADSARRLPRLLAAQVAYQLRLLARTPRALFSALLLPVMLLAVLQMTRAGAAAPPAELVAGIMAFGVISTSFATHATGLVTARERGVLKRLHGTPLPAWTYLAGRILATTVLSLVSAAATLLTAVLLFNLHPTPSMLGPLAAVVVAGSLTWAALGTAASGLIPDPGAAWAMLSAIFLPVVFISGVFFPTAGEPQWLASLAAWLPALPFAGAMHAALGGSAAGIGHDLLLLAGWMAAGAVAARILFRWVPLPPRAARAGGGAR